MKAVRIWDLPTRLFHWALVLCVCISVVSAKLGGNAMEWHMRCGYTVLALLGFRILWGMVGGRWSRFSSFVRGPATLRRYLRGELPAAEHAGHNPLGALSVLLMLLWLLVQVATGLVADDEIATTGPLVRFVSGKLSSLATGWHAGAGQWGLYALIALHLGAIVFHAARKRDRLVTAMFSGDKRFAAHVPATRDSVASRAFALAVLAACAAAVYLLVSLGNG